MVNPEELTERIFREKYMTGNELAERIRKVQREKFGQTSYPSFSGILTKNPGLSYKFRFIAGPIEQTRILASRIPKYRYIKTVVFVYTVIEDYTTYHFYLPKSVALRTLNDFAAKDKTIAAAFAETLEKANPNVLWSATAIKVGGDTRFTKTTVNFDSFDNFLDSATPEGFLGIEEDALRRDVPPLGDFRGEREVKWYKDIADLPSVVGPEPQEIAEADPELTQLLKDIDIRKQEINQEAPNENPPRTQLGEYGGRKLIL